MSASLCPAGNNQHRATIEKSLHQQEQQQQEQQQQEPQPPLRQPHTKHLPPGLPGAVDGHPHHHHRRAVRTPASSSSSSSDAGDGSNTPQQAISTYLRRISQAAEALAAAADQEDHALRAGGVLPSDGNLLVMEAICRETVGALHAIHNCSRAVAAASSSDSTPSPSPDSRTDEQQRRHHHLYPRKQQLLPPPSHLRRHRVPPATTATTASSSTPSSAAAAAIVEAKGAAAAAGAPPPPRRRRTCTQCGCTETPFWRRGPHGSRSLCNVCGLLYARRARDRREASHGRTLQWAGSTAGGGGGDLSSWRGSGGSSGSLLFP